MPDTLPILLMTRPRDSAERFVAALRKGGTGGFVPLYSPLIRIVHAGQPPDPADHDAVIFTSANGVQAFVALGGIPGGDAYAVGAATADAARRAGFDATEAGGDADALISRIIADARPGRLVHIRGEHARGDVAQRLTLAGIETNEAILYNQVAQPLSSAAQTALDGAVPVVAPLFSPRSAALFAAEAPFRAPLFLAALSDAVATELSAIPAVALAIAPEPRSGAIEKIVSIQIDRAAALEGRRGAE